MELRTMKTYEFDANVWEMNKFEMKIYILCFGIHKNNFGIAWGCFGIQRDDRGIVEI